MNTVTPHYAYYIIILLSVSINLRTEKNVQYCMQQRYFDCENPLQLSFQIYFQDIYLTIFQNFNAVELFVSIFHSFEAIMAMQKHYA